MLNIRPINKDEFEVQSHSNPDTWYKVNLINQSCSCPHYRTRLKYTGGTCKHYTDLLNHVNEIQDKFVDTFKQIEKEIKQKVTVPWDDISDKYGEDTVKQMIRLGKIYESKRGYLSIL